MLPYFFRNYDGWVDKFVIFDNGSTDGSQDIIASHPYATLHTFKDEGDSHELSALGVHNLAWKQSIGVADWVVICDVDEHLWHSNMKDYLNNARRRGVTAIRPEAYEMVADSFLDYPGPLWRSVTRGVRQPFFDKLGPFNPDAIEDTNFDVGRHIEQLTGNVVFETDPQIKMLHYKQLGAEYVVERHMHLSKRLRGKDIDKGWGSHWRWSAKRIRAHHRLLTMQSKVVITDSDGKI